MGSKVGKTLFSHVYDENPVEFKKDFKKLLKDKIMNKIDTKRSQIISDINKKTDTSASDIPDDPNNEE